MHLINGKTPAGKFPRALLFFPKICYIVAVRPAGWSTLSSRMDQKRQQPWKEAQK
jgi:hypothetical protein